LPFVQDSNSGRSAEHGGGEPVQRKKLRKNQLGEGSSRNYSQQVALMTPSVVSGSLQPDMQKQADLLNNIAGKTAADALCQLDGDLSFMVSLLPTIKSMNEKQKINFKIGILQLVSQIKFEEVLNHPSGSLYGAPFISTTPNFEGFSMSSQPVGAMGVPPLQSLVNRGTVSSTQQRLQNHQRNHQHHLDHDSSVKQEIIDSSYECDTEDDKDSS